MIKASPPIFAAAVLAALSSVHADVFWMGSINNSWATAANWSNSAGPAPTDVASFASTGSANAPGDVTSLLNANRSIGGLYFNNTAGHYHAVDLNGDTLTCNGNLNINLDQSSSTTATLRDGTLVMGGGYANINIGRAVSASASGIADLTGLSALNATLQTMEVGTSSYGLATGTLMLPPSNSIAAQTIQVGASNSSSDTNGTLVLGQNNTITANEFDVGKDNSNGLVSITSGGSLTLGTAAQPTLLQVANSRVATTTAYSSKMDLSFSTFNAVLSGLVVGQVNGGGGGSTTGTLLGGNGGSITIGSAGNTTECYIGNSLSGGGSATGNVNLSNLTNLSANLDTLSLGTALSGSAQGTLTLALSNTINANYVIVGSSGNGNNVLTLGQSNTILTNQLTIAQDYSNGTITLPTGGALNLGSPSNRTSLYIANGTTNTSSTFAGTLDASRGIINAYLGNVVIGTKNAEPGTEQGTFSIGTSSANRVDATSITLGGNQAIGTLNFGGGILYAGSISAGTGTPVFKWTGGQLSVGTFGSPSTLFNLTNAGTGILAPGSDTSSIGVTTVYGNYNQSSAATTALDIGSSSSTSDQINITGIATLAGTLAINLANGFTPSTGQSYLLETYASHNGSYGFVSPPALPAGVAINLDYSTPTQLVLSFVSPGAANYISTAAFGTFSTASNWDTKAAPGTANNAMLINNGPSSKSVNISTSTSVDSLTVQGGNSTMEADVPAGVEFAIAGVTTIASNGTLSIAAGGSVVAQGGITGAGTTFIAAGATLNSAFVRQANLTINGTLTLQAASPHHSAATFNVVTNLTLGGSTGAWTGHLDLANTDLDIQHTTLATVWNQIASGYSSGNWNGSGITSSAAASDSHHLTTLGVISNSVDGTTPLYGSGTALGLFDGIGPAATDVLVKYTYYGDANLDGKIDGSDYSRIDNGYLTRSTGWFNGDFNYDGIINGSDYTLIDNAFNTQGTSLATLIASPTASITAESAGSSPVPEPSTIGSISSLMTLTLRRRRRCPVPLSQYACCR